MDDDELKFSWTIMFFVTGLSSIVFNFITKFLDGSHSSLLLSIAAGTFALGLCSWIINIVSIQSKRKRKKRSASTY